MKKLMLMVAMLAMMLAMAAPAFAQINIDEGDIEGNDVQFNAGAQNIIGSVGDITQHQSATTSGDTEAIARDGSIAAAEGADITQEQDVSISQENEFGNNGFFFFRWWL